MKRKVYTCPKCSGHVVKKLLPSGMVSFICLGCKKKYRTDVGTGRPKYGKLILEPTKKPKGLKVDEVRLGDPIGGCIVRFCSADKRTVGRWFKAASKIIGAYNEYYSDSKRDIATVHWTDRRKDAISIKFKSRKAARKAAEFFISRMR